MRAFIQRQQLLMHNHIDVAWNLGSRALTSIGYLTMFIYIYEYTIIIIVIIYITNAYDHLKRKFFDGKYVHVLNEVDGKFFMENFD